MSPEHEPSLTRIGGGRAWRLAGMLAVGLLVGSVAISLAERRPNGVGPQESAVSLLPSLEPTPEPPRFNALDRGTGWPPDSRQRAAPIFEVVLLSHEGDVERVRLEGSPVALEARVAIAPELWVHGGRLRISWSDGRRNGRREQVANIRLSLGSRDHPGLPIELASGGALLPAQVTGSRHWRYEIALERAHAYSDPHEWVAAVRLTAQPAPGARSVAQPAPLILLTATPAHPIRATRVHGVSWVAGR